MAEDKQDVQGGVNGAASAQAAVFVPSEDLSQSATKIRGPDFNMPYELQGLLNSYATIGFQASGLTRAIEIINKMVSTCPAWSTTTCTCRHLAYTHGFLILSKI